MAKDYRQALMAEHGSEPERALAFALRAEGINGWRREVPFKGFSGKRRWRWDLAWCHQDAPRGPKLAVEVQGGMGAVRGAHARTEGARNDYHKSAEGQMLGWMVLHIEPSMIRDGEAVRLIRDALGRLEEL